MKLLTSSEARLLVWTSIQSCIGHGAHASECNQSHASAADLKLGPKGMGSKWWKATAVNCLADVVMSRTQLNTCVQTRHSARGVP